MTQTKRFFHPGRRERTSTQHPAVAESPVYVYYNDDIAIAVNVAIATGRPLLLSGPSGCGKSSLARSVASFLGYRYYEYVVTARSEARDILYRFDAVRRLSDAQITNQSLRPSVYYVEPGPLWWALDPESAANRGSAQELAPDVRGVDPSPPHNETEAVVLIDEIDKADPDFPNSLLVPLGSYRFTVDETNTVVSGSQAPLIFITNNGERELPATFVRRCVALTMRTPGEDELIEVARESVATGDWNEPLFRSLARKLAQLADDPLVAVAQRSSTAEFLDAVRACVELGIRSTDDPKFTVIEQITLSKSQPVA